MRLFINIGNIALLLILLTYCSCKKPNSAQEPPVVVSGFHIDNIINTNDRTYTLLFAPLPGNSNFIRISSGGGPYTSVNLFKLMLIDKSSGLKSLTNYFIDPKYSYHFTTCTDMDNNGNIWLGGNFLKDNDPYYKPFIIKLDKNGNVLLSQYLTIHRNIYYQDYYRGCSVQVLNNGDILYLLSDFSDLQLIRMKNTGEIIWMKKYISHGETIYQPSNLRFIENTSGQLLFLVNGSALFKTDAKGNLLYQKQYSIEGALKNIYALSTGEILLTGTNNYSSNSYIPYLFKIDPETANILGGKITTYQGTGNMDFSINDLHEVNGQLRFVFTTNYQYNTITMDRDFNIINSQRTLGKNSAQGFGNGVHLYFDTSNNAIYHLIDDAGPAGGSGFQFLKTDINGKSCHTYTATPISLNLINSSFTVSNSQYTMDTTSSTLTLTPLTLNQSIDNNISTADACN